MDLRKFVEEQSLTNFLVGLGGCRTTNSFFDSCDYDITIFDDKSESDKIIFYDEHFIRIHHGSLKETKSDILVKYDGMQILHDDSWELRMFLSKIKEKRLTLYKDYAKNCLFDSLFCCEKTKEGIKTSNVFSSCWQICASYFLADAICSLNLYRPNPTHMLDMMCKFEKNQINDQISTAIALLTVMKGLPLSYNRDLQEDKIPVFDTVDAVKSCLVVLNEMFPGIAFNTKRMRDTAGDAYSTATDIAEYLVRKGIPFRHAHEITGRIVLSCITQKKRLDELSLKELRTFSPLISSDIFPFLKPEESVRNRKSQGGTAPDEVKKQINRLRKTVGSR